MPHSIKTSSRSERQQQTLNGYATESWTLTDESQPASMFVSADFVNCSKQSQRPSRAQLPSSPTPTQGEEDADDSIGVSITSRHSDEAVVQHNQLGSADVETKSLNRSLNSHSNCSPPDEESGGKSPSSDQSSTEDIALAQHSGPEIWNVAENLSKPNRTNGTVNLSNLDRFSPTDKSVQRITNSTLDLSGTTTTVEKSRDEFWHQRSSNRTDETYLHASPTSQLPNWCGQPKPFTQPVGMPKSKRVTELETSESRDGLKSRPNTRSDIENKLDTEKLHIKTKSPRNQKQEVNRQQRKGVNSRYPQSETDSENLFPDLSTSQESGMAGTDHPVDSVNPIVPSDEEPNTNQFRLSQFDAPLDPKSQYGMLPLGANNLAAAAAATMSPLFQNPGIDWHSHPTDDHHQTANPSTEGQFSAASSASSLQNTSTKSMDTCFPPMLAAAAVAALTGGRFPTTGASFPSFNPIFSSSNPGIYPTGSLSDVQSAMGFDRAAMSAAGLMSNAPMSSADMAKELLFSPIRAMYNTSKSLFDPTGLSGLVSCNRTGTTPPPPPLSASTSPQPMHPQRCTRNAVSASSGNYCGSVDDGRDEGDEGESVDGADQSNEMEESVGNANGHQWTFEEQFKQLYVLSDDPKRKEFLDELFAYMQRRGTPVNRIPIMAKQVLDLYELFQLVVARGGLVEVINKKLWREITKGLNLPSSITSAAFTLRTQYMKYLYPYECDTLGLSTPSELQAAIDGNRREARRSSYSFDYPIMMPPGSSNRPGSPSNLMGSHSTGSSLAASAINAAVAAAAMGQSLPSQAGSFPPSGLNGGALPASLQHLSAPSLPFGPGGLGFQSPLNQLHPLLGLPPVSLGGANLPSLTNPPHPAFSASHIGSTATSQSLFASTFMNPMASNNPFPLSGASAFPTFPTGLTSSEDSILTSTPPPTASTTTQPAVTQPSSCLLSSNLDGNATTHFSDTTAMAAAAAAASLFGTGFPQLPGAFATTPPQLTPSGGSRTTVTNTGGRDQDSLGEQHSPSSSNEAMDNANTGRTQRKEHVKHSNDGDTPSRSAEPSPSPLNLAATDDNSSSMGRLRSAGIGSKREEKKRPLSADQQLSRCTNGSQNEFQAGLDGKFLKSDLDEGKRSLVCSATNSLASTIHKTRPTSVHGVSPSPNIPTPDSEDALSKGATQAACHQIWAAAAAAAAAAAGFHNNVGNSDENSSNCEHLFDQSSNSAAHSDSLNSRQNHTASQPSASIGKRPNTRGTGAFDGPNPKVPRTGNALASPVDSTNKRYFSTAVSGTVRKCGTNSAEYRRTADNQSGSGSNLTTNQHANHIGVGNFALATQNLRIQTQSGGPMGLPQNAMVVTMEMGNVLYQGVLFGQCKR